MKVGEVSKALNLKVLARSRERSVKDGYVSDMLSDVIANAEEGCLWITVQRHLNIIAVAQLKKIAGIIISHGGQPEAAVIEKAEQEGIFILQSDESSFAVAGKLYSLIHHPSR